MKRHNARIISVLVLYNKDINSYTYDETINAYHNLMNELNEDEYMVEVDNDYALKLVEGTLLSLLDIDNIISSNLVNYSLNRLSYVDRAIIRIATYEMLNKVDKKIVINEALQITREYSEIDNDKQVKFTNKVLDQISNHIESTLNK